MILIPDLEKQRNLDICEFEANLISIQRQPGVPGETLFQQTNKHTNTQFPRNLCLVSTIVLFCDEVIAGLSFFVYIYLARMCLYVYGHVPWPESGGEGTTLRNHFLLPLPGIKCRSQGLDGSAFTC